MPTDNIYQSIFSCKFCSKSLKNKNALSNHQIRCKENPEKIKNTGFIKSSEDIAKIQLNNYKKEIPICLNCNKELSYEKRKGKFCNKSCSAQYNNKHRNIDLKNKNSKISKSLKLKPILCIPKLLNCENCNNQFYNIKKFNPKTCSKLCHKELLSKNARNNKGLGTKRSKDEIKLFELLSKNFNCEPNKKLVNGWDCDIALIDYQIAILWNGPWHYREMNIGNHSLKQVQNRDNIKIKEFNNIGWETIIFEDRYYTPESAYEFINNKLGASPQGRTGISSIMS